MPEEEGFSEIGAVVSLDGLQETLTGMEHYNAGIQGMADATRQQAGQISTNWDGVAQDTRQALDATVAAVEEGMKKMQGATFDPGTERWRDDITGQFVSPEMVEAVGKQWDKISQGTQRSLDEMVAAAEAASQEMAQYISEPYLGDEAYRSAVTGLVIPTEDVTAVRAELESLKAEIQEVFDVTWEPTGVVEALDEIQGGFGEATQAAVAWAEANYAAAAPINEHIAYMQMWGDVTEEMTEEAAGLEDSLESQGLVFSKLVVWLQETGSYTDKWGRNWGTTIEEAKDTAEKFGIELAVVGDKGEDMADDLEEADEAVDDLGKKSKVATGMLSQLLRSLGQHRAASIAATTGWGSFAVGLGVVTAAGAAAWQVLSATYVALERTEPLWDARDAFAALGAQVSMTSKSIVKDTQRASSFTVSEYAIIVSANNDLLAGNEALADSYSDLMQLAYVVSRTTGKSVEQSFNAITAAVRSGSQAALEAAGVWIDVETAQKAFAETQDRRLDQLSEEERQLIALQVVLSEMPGYIEGMGGAMESALAPIRELTTEIGLLKDEMLATMGTKFVEWLAGITGFVWGKDPVTLLKETRESVAAIEEIKKLSAEAYQRRDEFTPEEYAQFRGGPGETLEAIGYEAWIKRARGLLGYPEPEAPPDPYAGISAHERRVLSPEELDKRVATMRQAEETAERMEEERTAAREELRQGAKGYVIGLAPYLTDAQLEQLYQRYIALGERVIDQNEDIYGRPAQQEMSRFKKEMSDLAAELRKVERGGAAAAKKLKEMQLGAGPIGEWAVDFAAEHGGRSPFEVYEKHEEPLVAATMDRLFGEKMMREIGRGPTHEERKAFWFKVHQPFELFQGGPIIGQKGPEYEEAKAFLAGLGVEEIGKAHHTEWMTRKGLITSLEGVKTQEEILAAFLEDTAIPAQEDQATAIDIATESTQNLITETDALAERFRVFFPTPPLGGEEGNGEEEDGVTLPPTKSLLDKTYFPLVKGDIPEEEWVWEGGPLQFGGISTRTQDVRVHDEEAIIPFGSPGVAAAILSQMLGRMGTNVGPLGQMGGGGVSIGQINIPISVGGNVTRQTAAMLQATIVEGIRHRVGAAIRREGRRLGR